MEDEPFAFTSATSSTHASQLKHIPKENRLDKMDLPNPALVRRSMTFPTRQPLLVGLPAEYMEKSNMVPDDMEFDTKLGQFRWRDTKLSIESLPASNDLKRQIEANRAVITAYASVGKLGFQTGGSLNLDTVLQDMKAAVEVYEALAEKDKKDTKIGKCRATIRKCFRSFSNHANSFRDWLAVVPDGDYGAVVCGSLQMIFKAAARLGKVRDDLMEALSEMPETIAMVRSYADIYTNSIRMRDGIHQFEVATLMALEHALLWLTETPFSKFIGVLRKQSAYGTDLDAAFKAFKKSVDKLNGMATLTLHEVIKDSSIHIRKGRIEQAQNTVAIAKIVKSEVQKLTKLTNAVLAQLSCNPRLKEVDPDRSWQQRAAIAQDKDDDESFEEDFAFRQINVLPAVHRKVLLRHIGNLFVNQARCDIEIIMSSALLMPFEEQDRQGFMTESDILKNLLSTAASGAVLIQGNSPHDDAIASTSVYAASLVTALQQLHVSVIHFACGLHSTRTDDPFLGPYGMMLALLQQFLEGYPSDSLAISHHNLRDQFANVQSIGRLMQILVSSEPRTSTTFCVIDGISFFENSTCEADTHEAISQLFEIASSAIGCFKLLITSPTRSMYVPQYLSSHRSQCDVLHVPAEIVHGRRQGERPSTLAQAMTDDIIQRRPPPQWQ